jgi:hypothetical protein
MKLESCKAKTLEVPNWAKGFHFKPGAAENMY